MFYGGVCALKNVSELLLKYFDEVVYCGGTILKDSLIQRQKEMLIKYSNPWCWWNGWLYKKGDKHKKKLKYFIVQDSVNLY